MRFNAYRPGPGPEFDTVETDRIDASSLSFNATGSKQDSLEAAFAIEAHSPLARAGCNPIYADGDLSCVGRDGPIGALLPNGMRFDVGLPFRFPFTGVLRPCMEAICADTDPSP
jgi:hypothetical protein